MSLAWLRIKLAIHLTLLLVGAAIGYVAAPILGCGPLAAIRNLLRSRE